MAFRKNLACLSIQSPQARIRRFEFQKCDQLFVRPRKDKRGVDLICDALPLGRLGYGGPNAISNAIGYAKFFSHSHDAMIRVYDESGNVIETHEHKGDFREFHSA